MEIYPRDLGTRRYLTLLRRRASVGSGKGHPGTMTAAAANSAALSADDVKPSRSRLVGAWTRNLKIKDPEARAKAATLALNGGAGVGLAVGMVLGTIYLTLPLFVVAMNASGMLAFLVFCAWVAAMFGLWYQVPRRALERMDSAPLTAGEIEALLLTARGRLDRAYLNLALDAVRQEGVTSASAQEDIRSALSALGETIDRLPAEPVRAQSAVDLQRAAEARRLEAGRETDPQARASLVRQAETLERRAQLGESGSAAARRARALRQEVMVQMDSLRAVLFAFDQSSVSPQARAVATGLSETVQRVTQEAESMAQAHRELQEDEIAALLGRAPQAIAHHPVSTAAPSATITVNGNGTTSPGASPSRKWWRNP